MTNSQTPRADAHLTEYGIPIRNLWHMLLYAWNEAPLSAMHGWMMQEAERAPALDTLLASILIRLMQQRLRIGLGHNYVEQERKFPGVRGRINFAESLKQLAALQVNGRDEDAEGGVSDVHRAPDGDRHQGPDLRVDRPDLVALEVERLRRVLVLEVRLAVDPRRRVGDVDVLPPQVEEVGLVQGGHGVLLIG